MTGFLIALLSGALMSVQGVFNTQVTKTTGMWVSNGWVQFSAFLLCGTQICITWRRDRCRDHMDRDQEYGGTGTGEGSASDCNLAVDRSVRNRTSRIVRSRQRTTGNP